MKDCSKFMSANPIVVEDCERVSDRVSASNPESSRRAEGLRHEIDKLQIALQVEQDKNKDLLQERDTAVKLCKSLFHQREQAEKAISLLQQRQMPECPICRENVCCGVTQCGHQFCDTCFNLWCETEEVAYSCPVCRAGLDDQNGKAFIRIYGTG